LLVQELDLVLVEVEDFEGLEVEQRIRDDLSIDSL